MYLTKSNYVKNNDKLSHRPIKWVKRGMAKKQIPKSKPKKVDITTEITDIRRIVREYCDKL